MFSTSNLSLQLNELSLAHSWLGPMFTLVVVVALSYSVILLTLKRGLYATTPVVKLVAAQKDRAYRFLDQHRLARRQVILTQPGQIDELSKAPYEVLSFGQAVDETLLFGPFLGRLMPVNNTSQPHVMVIRSQLTKNLARMFNGIHEEIRSAFDENIPLTEDWVPVHAFPKFRQIVARVSARALVGLPICRNQEYLQVTLDFLNNMLTSLDGLHRFPTFLRPLAAKYLSTVSRPIALITKHLEPIIEERRKKAEEYNPEYTDTPVDVLSWLMDEATGDELSVTRLTGSILILSFGSIHTTSMNFIHTLYHLAAEPHYVRPIREEIETILSKEEWSKAALTKMHQLDSFFKESQRYNSPYVTTMRIALKDFNLSDGTLIPKGTFVAAGAYEIHRDETRYPDGDKFYGFRFARLGSQNGGGTTNQLIRTSPDYVSFGHGKHACPGRFFAAIEMKTMMAHLILNYDIKMEKEGVRPPNGMNFLSCPPDVTARVMFRRRR